MCVTGWSWECLDDWASFSGVVVFSIFMTLLYWLCTEVGTFLAGLCNTQLPNYNLEYNIVLYCIVLYSFIVQFDRTQLILHTSSFAYIVYL